MIAVHFGAGNIGLGFIGLLLSQAGCEVRFVDVNEERVVLLNERRQYTVTLADEREESIIVRHVSAIPGRDTARVARAIAEADLVTTAVGPTALPHLAPAVAEGIRLRLAVGEEARPLAVIACENAIGGSTRLRQHVWERLDAGMRERAASLVAFPDAAVDRIVPLQQHDDPLQVTVEPFYEWVVERPANAVRLPDVHGLRAVDKLEPYIERKLFTLNTGHCIAAYLGYLQGCATIQEAMRNKSIAAALREALEETGELLVRRHGLNREEHRRYIDIIMERFRNPHLTDEVLRVGRSPLRKLSPNDRLIMPARLAAECGMETPGLIAGIAAALSFGYEGDPEAAELRRAIDERGVAAFVETHAGIGREHPLHGKIVRAYESLNQAQEV